MTSLDDLRKAQTNLKPGDAVAFRVMRPLRVAANRKGTEAPYQTFCATATLPGKQQPTMSRKPQRKVLSVCLARRCFKRPADNLRTSFAGRFQIGKVGVVSNCQRNYV